MENEIVMDECSHCHKTFPVNELYSICGEIGCAECHADFFEALQRETKRLNNEKTNQTPA